MLLPLSRSPDDRWDADPVARPGRKGPGRSVPRWGWTLGSVRSGVPLWVDPRKHRPPKHQKTLGVAGGGVFEVDGVLDGWIVVEDRGPTIVWSPATRSLWVGSNLSPRRGSRSCSRRSRS